MMRSSRPLRRAVLTAMILPAALSVSASAAIIILNGTQNPYTLTSDPFYDGGLLEFYKNAANSTDDSLSTFTPNGTRDRPRMGEHFSDPPDGGVFQGPNTWSDNQSWAYTGQFFDADGTFTFAENIDDNTRVFIDGVLVLSDNAWNVATRTNVAGAANNGNFYGMGPDGDGWHNIEIRFYNGGGGAGSGDTTNGWGLGDNPTFNRKGFGLNVNGTTSINGADYIIPIEPAGGGETVFRNLIAGSGNDILRIQASSTATLTGTGASVPEAQIRFETGATPVTLTFNNSDAVQRILGSVQTLFGNDNNSEITIAGTGHFRPGGSTDNGFTGGTLIKNGGTGSLIFDAAFNDLDGMTLRTVDGRISVEGNGYNPLSTLANPIQMNGTNAILRFGGVGFSPISTTFNNSIAVNETSTLEHVSFRTDTLSGAITVAPGKTLNANFAGGILRSTGTVSGNQINKTGPGELDLGGNTTLEGVSVSGGRLRLSGNTTLTTSPVINPGGILALTGTGVTYTFPDPLNVPTGGTLEIFSGPAGTRQTNLSGGVLVLGGDNGLTGQYWNSAPANTANSNPNWGPLPLVQGVGNANGTNTPGSGNFTSFQALYDTGLGAPTVTALSTANAVQNFNFGNNNGGPDAPFAIFGANFADNIQARWSGKILVPVAGVYAFSTRSDDGSAVFIDGASVVDNNMFQGMTTRGGSVFLQPGLHDIVMGFYEGGGGAGIEVNITVPGGTSMFLPNSMLFPSADAPTFNNPINVIENSTINTAYFGANAADLTIQPGKTLTTTGNVLTVGTLKLRTSGAYTLNTSGVDNVVIATVLDDNAGAAALTINKTGEGLFVLDNTTTAQLTNAGNIINLSQGTLGILLGGAFSPTGVSTINFNGGGLVLSSKGGDQTYPLPPAGFGGTSPSVEARKVGSGVAGPLNMTLGGNLNVPAAQTLNLKTADDYTMILGGTASGAGVVSVNGGRVNATTDGAVGGLGVAFNTFASAILNFRTTAPTIASLSSNTGATAAQVLLGDGTNNPTLVINQATNTTYAGGITQPAGSTGKVIKRGVGKLTLTGSTHDYSGGLTIEAGTVTTTASGLGTGGVTLSGGIIQAGRLFGLTGEYWDSTVGGDGGAEGGLAGDLAAFNAYFAGKPAPVVTAQTITNGRINLKFSDGGGIEGGGPDTATFADQGFTAVNNMAVRFSGQIDIANAGLYTFTTRSDDGSVIYIDGVKVVNNNFYQGMTTRSGTITLAAGSHTISIGFYEGGGGSGLEARFTPPAGVDQFIPNSALYSNPTLVGPNTVLMTASSTIDPAGGRVQLGIITIPPNLTLTGLDGTIAFPSTVLTGVGGTTYTFNQQAGSISLGNVTDGGNEVDLVKTGAGTLVLPSPAAPQLAGANSSIAANGGTVFGVGGDVNSPFGNAPITVNNGGGIGFASVSGTAAFTNPVTLNGTASVTAGNPGFGAVNNAVVTLQAPLNNTGTLNLSTTSGYTLNLDTVTGSGAINMTGGIVNGNAPVSAGAVTISGPAPVGTATISSIFSAFDNFTAASVNIQASGALRTAGGVTVPGGVTVGASGEFQLTGGVHNAPVVLAGGIVRAVSGITDFGTNTITGSAPSITSNALRGVLQRTGADGSGAAFPGNTDGGILGAQLREPEAAISLTSPVSIVDNAAADAAFSTLFGGAPVVGSRFTAAFLGRITATEGGLWQFQLTTVDDTAAFWVDLNQNGIFETNGSAGSEAISGRGCCGPAPVGMATLVAGQTYNTAFAVEDTGGNSGLTASVQRPSDPGLILVNPGDAGQAGVWSFNSPATQGGVIVEGGAELRVARLNQATVATLIGAGARLQISSGTVVSDAIVGLSALIGGGSGTLDLGGNNTLNVSSLSVSPTGTLIKTGAGTLNAASQSIGATGMLQVDGGLVNLNGAVNAFNGALPGAANTGGVTVNATGRVNVNGALSGAVQVNTGGTLGGTGTTGPVTVTAGGVVAPGLSVGTLNTLDVTLSASANLAIEILNASSFDRLNVTGLVSLDQASLQLGFVPGLAITTGDLFFIVTNDLTDPVTGTFAGLADGATFNFAGADFRIEYDGDFGALAQTGGNDVLLVALNTIPEPGAFAALLGGAGLLVGLRRYRRDQR